MTGCATIMSGETQTLTFNSNPPGADVIVDGATVGVTPVTYEARRKGRGAVEIRKEGYKPQHMVLSKKLNPMFLGNVFCGGTFGSSTDASTGAMREYSQDAFYATLEPDAQAPAAASADKTNALRDFVLVNFDSLRRESAGGSGEYIKALNSLSYRRNEKVYSTSDLRAVFATCDGPVSCAETIAGDREAPKVAPIAADTSSSKTIAQADKPTSPRRRR